MTLHTVIKCFKFTEITGLRKVALTTTLARLFVSALQTGRAETIIRTNRLVGYQSTGQRQYYEIG